jgi:hypothetical protein
MLRVKAAGFHDRLWRSRHGKELFDQSDRLSADVIQAFRSEFADLIGEVLGQAQHAGEIDLSRLGLSAAEAAGFLFHAADGLHERHVGSPVAPEIYHRRLDVLVDCFLAATAT